MPTLQLARLQGRLGAEIGQQRDAQPRHRRLSQRLAVVGAERSRHRHGDALSLRPAPALGREEMPGRGVLRARVMQAVVSSQVLRRGGRALAPQVVAAGDQHRSRLAQRPGHMRVGGRCGVPDGEVEALGGQGIQAIGHVQFEPDLRMRAQELGEPGYQLLARKRHRRGDPHQPGGFVGEVAHAGETLRDALEGVAHAGHQLLACLGQAHAARGALHQRHARGPFQFGDVLAHGRLAHAQPLRGRGVAALLRQHREPVKVRPETFDFFLVHAGIVHQSEQSVQARPLGARACAP